MQSTSVINSVQAVSQLVLGIITVAVWVQHIQDLSRFQAQVPLRSTGATHLDQPACLIESWVSFLGLFTSGMVQDQTQRELTPKIIYLYILG